MSALSGGNAQKLIAAREFASEPRFLIADEPTRGIDVAAAAFLHDRIRAMAASGVGVLLVTSDLDELLALSDRVVVMFGGRIVARLEKQRDAHAGSPRPVHARTGGRSMNRKALAPAVVTIALLALVVAAVMLPLALTTADPAGVMQTFLFGPFRNLRYLGNIVEMATPHHALRPRRCADVPVGMFNLGVEGAFFLGGLATVATALLLPLPTWVAAPVALLVGAVIGSTVCVIPGVMRAQFDVSELVTSLMLNFVALFVGLFILNYFLRDPTAGAMASYKIPLEAQLPRILPGTRVHLGTVLALLARVAGAIYLFRTRGGFEARLVGSNRFFAAHLGLPLRWVMMRSAIIGGVIAAAAGGIEMLGLYARFSWQVLPGTGWIGVTVAILARTIPCS